MCILWSTKTGSSIFTVGWLLVWAREPAASSSSVLKVEKVNISICKHLAEQFHEFSLDQKSYYLGNCLLYSGYLKLKQMYCVKETSLVILRASSDIFPSTITSLSMVGWPSLPFPKSVLLWARKPTASSSSVLKVQKVKISICKHLAKQVHEFALVQKPYYLGKCVIYSG